MRRTNVDPDNLIRWIVDEFPLGEVISTIGREDVLNELGATECAGHFGIDLLDEFSREAVLKHFDIEEVEE